MKQLVVLVLILLLIGCGSPAKNATSGNNPPPPPQTSSLVGTWTGTVTGTNFTGSGPFSILVCYQGSGCSATSGTSVYVETATVGGFDCGGISPGGSTGSLTVNGQQFSASGSGTTGPGQGSIPWTLLLNGTVASGNQSMSGNVSFSLPPCGTAANPWTGTFSATLQP